MGVRDASQRLRLTAALPADSAAGGGSNPLAGRAQRVSSPAHLALALNEAARNLGASSRNVAAGPRADAVGAGAGAGGFPAGGEPLFVVLGADAELLPLPLADALARQPRPVFGLVLPPQVRIRTLQNCSVVVSVPMDSAHGFSLHRPV